MVPKIFLFTNVDFVWFVLMFITGINLISTSLLLNKFVPAQSTSNTVGLAALSNTLNFTFFIVSFLWMAFRIVGGIHVQ